MATQNKSSPELDFVLFPGDPDSGEGAIDSRAAISGFETLRNRFSTQVYGAILLTKSGKRIVEPVGDPLIDLVTKMLRCVPYILEGEPETVLLAESEHGFLLEPASDDLQLSFFRGSDAFDPDEYLVEKVHMPLQEFCDQTVGMGDRLIELLKKHDPKKYDADDLVKALLEMHDTAKSAARRFRLEKERGLAGRR